MSACARAPRSLNHLGLTEQRTDYSLIINIPPSKSAYETVNGDPAAHRSGAGSQICNQVSVGPQPLTTSTYRSFPTVPLPAKSGLPNVRTGHVEERRAAGGGGGHMAIQRGGITWRKNASYYLCNLLIGVHAKHFTE